MSTPAAATQDGVVAAVRSALGSVLQGLSLGPRLLKRSLTRFGRRARRAAKAAAMRRQRRSERRLRSDALAKLRAATSPGFNLQALEPRIVFDGAGIATAVDLSEPVDVPAEQVAEDTAAHAESVETTRELAEAVMARAGTAPIEREEIVFIDAGVEDADALRGSVPASAEIIELDAGSDGMAQIAAALADRRGIDAIHIVSHGDAGELRLGNGTLNEASMGGEHADALSVIAAALAADADVLIYGCDFGADARGASAVETFKELTGADIAASDDDTGHAELGGDWNL
ncbi:MAG: DUF4347 domain-containing protein, partial [Pseudomonadota bacterium]